MFKNSEFRKYFFNTSWLLADRTLRLILGVVISAVLARYLKPEQFGLLNYAQSFVFLFSALGTLGLESILVRDLVKYENKRDIFLGTAFGLKLVGSILSCILIFFVVQFSEDDVLLRVLIIILSLTTVLQSFNVIDFYFQSQVISKYAVSANFISLIFSVVLKFYLIFIKASLIMIALSFIFDALILALGYIYFYNRQKLSWLNWKFSPSAAASLLKDSCPLIFSGFFISIYMRVDQIMLQYMLGSHAVGLYSAAVRISEAWYFVPIAIMSSLLPTIVNAKQTNEDFYLRKLQKFFTLMIWLAIGVALPVTFLSGFIIKLIYGSIYEPAGTILMIHIWTGIFVAFGVARGAWIINQNLQIFSLVITGIGAFANIALNLYFIPVYGAVGAAVGTLLSYILTTTILPIIHPIDRKTVPMFFKSFSAPWYFLK